MSLLEPGSGYAGFEVEYANANRGRGGRDTFDLDEDAAVEIVKDRGVDEEFGADAAVELEPGQL